MTRILQVTERPEHDVDEELLVHAWRTEQLRRLGLPAAVAEAYADLVEWHALAELVERGCAPRCALEILR